MLSNIYNIQANKKGWLFKQKHCFWKSIQSCFTSGLFQETSFLAWTSSLLGKWCFDVKVEKKWKQLRTRFIFLTRYILLDTRSRRLLVFSIMWKKQVVCCSRQLSSYNGSRRNCEQVLLTLMLTLSTVFKPVLLLFNRVVSVDLKWSRWFELRGR